MKLDLVLKYHVKAEPLKRPRADWYSSVSNTTCFLQYIYPFQKRINRFHLYGATEDVETNNKFCGGDIARGEDILGEPFKSKSPS